MNQRVDFRSVEAERFADIDEDRQIGEAERCEVGIVRYTQIREALGQFALEDKQLIVS